MILLYYFESLIVPLYVLLLIICEELNKAVSLGKCGMNDSTSLSPNRANKFNSIN